MISVIVCHRDPALFEQFKSSLSATIGVDYELICIDNSRNNYTIFEAYNEGVKRAKGKILCFSHEDIIFHTLDWGKNVLKHFEDDRIGMIGVAGGNCFPYSPSFWWSDSSFNNHLINLLQRWPTKSPKQKYHYNLDDKGYFTIAYNNPSGETSVRAAVVDGLWFCIRRTLFDHIRFDEETYNGFHCYDTDISLQVNEHAMVCVVYDVLVEHLSDANANKQFFDSCIKHFDKWKDKLPLIYRKNYNQDELDRYLVNAILEFAYSMKSNAFYSDSEIREVIRNCLRGLKLQHRPKEFYLLWLWGLLGYNLAPYPYFLIRKLYSDGA
ncbi:MAG: hypothetical protein Kow0075_08290 [Salibacteraceae bacterium]